MISEVLERDEWQGQVRIAALHSTQEVLLSVFFICKTVRLWHRWWHFHSLYYKDTLTLHIAEPYRCSHHGEELNPRLLFNTNSLVILHPVPGPHRRDACPWLWTVSETYCPPPDSEKWPSHWIMAVWWGCRTHIWIRRFREGVIAVLLLFGLCVWVCVLYFGFLFGCLVGWLVCF